VKCRNPPPSAKTTDAARSSLVPLHLRTSDTGVQLLRVGSKPFSALLLLPERMSSELGASTGLHGVLVSDAVSSSSAAGGLELVHSGIVGV